MINNIQICFIIEILTPKTTVKTKNTALELIFTAIGIQCNINFT